jgi:hypothetical protein
MVDRSEKPIRIRMIVEVTASEEELQRAFAAIEGGTMETSCLLPHGADNVTFELFRGDALVGTIHQGPRAH